MKKFALIFSAAYLVITLVLIGIMTALNVNHSSGLAFVSLFVAASVPARFFYKEHARQATPSEVRRFSWLAVIGVWAASVIMAVPYMALVLTPIEIKELGEAIGSRLIISVIVLSWMILTWIYYFTIRWAFSWFIKLYEKNASPA
jgi:hypothetical protein